MVEVNVGTVANDGTGDALRSAFIKINADMNAVKAGLDAIEQVPDAVALVEAVEQAQASATAAANTVNQTNIAKTAAENASAAAQAARDSAVVAKDAAIAASGTVGFFATTAAGLAAVSEGQYFFSAEGATTGTERQYRKVSGAAVAAVPPVERYLSAFIDTSLAGKVSVEALPEVVTGAAYAPIAVGANGMVPLWLEDGLLNAAGMTDALKTNATSGVIQGITAASFASPIFVFGDDVVLWLDGNGLQGPAIDKRVDALASIYEPKRSPLSATLPLATDGRSLWRDRAKTGAVLAGSVARRKIALTGDSWTDLTTIPEALRAMLASDFTVDRGWRSVLPATPVWGDTYSASGWTAYDGAATSTFPYGVGADGNGISATSTTASVSWTTTNATQITIYSRKYGGTWRYRVDGGNYTTVTEGTDGGLTITKINGLSDTSHVLQIDCTGNTGTVSFSGFYSSRPEYGGVEILRMGNGGTRGVRVSSYAPYMTDIVADIAPDTVIVCLGTNDYRVSGSTVQTYLSGIQAIRDNWRAASPGIGFIFVAPAQSSGTAVFPLSDIRDALYEWCLMEGHEFYNMYDDWETYDNENAQAQWSDLLHISSAGAKRLVRRLDQFFALKG